MDPERDGWTKVESVYDADAQTTYNLRTADDARRLMARLNTALSQVHATLEYRWRDAGGVKVTGVHLNGTLFDLSKNSDTRKFCARVNTLLGH
jgi:hypothetical protein